VNIHVQHESGVAFKPFGLLDKLNNDLPVLKALAAAGPQHRLVQNLDKAHTLVQFWEQPLQGAATLLDTAARLHQLGPFENKTPRFWRREQFVYSDWKIVASVLEDSTPEFLIGFPFNHDDPPELQHYYASYVRRKMKGLPRIYNAIVEAVQVNGYMPHRDCTWGDPRFKTQICKNGVRCSSISRCHLLHDGLQKSLKGQMMRAKTSMCTGSAETTKCARLPDDCHYAHSQTELRCAFGKECRQFLQQGSVMRLCPFAHAGEKVRGLQPRG